MKRTRNISLYLVSNIILTSCDGQPKNRYMSIQECERDYTPHVCASSYDKALMKDINMQPVTKDECYRQYSNCREKGIGFVPTMRGFIVQLPDNGEPWYEHRTKRRFWHSSNGWGSKPRSGGFGSHGMSSGG